MTSNVGPFPVNLPFRVDVDVSKRYIPIIIQEWDDDSGSTNDQCDIKPGPGKQLSLTLDLATCQISGDASGDCDTSIILMGNTVDFFKFKILKPEEPAYASG